MRISDWSSDVSSSDLADRRHRTIRHPRAARPISGVGRRPDLARHIGPWAVRRDLHAVLQPDAVQISPAQTLSEMARRALHHPVVDRGHPGASPFARQPAQLRSEEHTSELQSLMRISYAVFCLKKKKHKYDTASTI